MKSVADSNDARLGGRIESEGWSWSEIFMWGYTNWRDGQGNGEDGSCVLSLGGWLYDASACIDNICSFVDCIYSMIVWN